MLNRTTLTEQLFSFYAVAHGGNHTIVPLEGIRAIAAFMVFIVHFSAQMTPWINQQSVTWTLIAYYRHLGTKGVDLFFVISGFLIYGMLISKDRPFWTYFKRRLQRIYPTFLAVLVLYLVLSFLFPTESKLPHHIADAILYVLSNIVMLPGMLNIPAIITVSWSLSYELFFYLCIPLIIYLFRLKTWQPSSRLTFLCLIGLCGYLLVYFGYDSHWEMVIFIGGMITHELYTMPNPCKKLNFNYFFPIIILLVVFIQYAHLPRHMETMVLLIGLPLFCLSCFNPRTRVSKICSSPLFRCYGNMSYSYYLIHGLTLKFFFLILGLFFHPHHQWDLSMYGLIIPVFVMTWIAATALFILIEKPFSLTRKPHPVTVKMEY